MPGFPTYDFYLYDATDTTKQLMFNTSNVPTSSLCTLITPVLPSSLSATLAALESNNSWTNVHVFQLATNGVPIRIAQATDGSQAAQLLRFTNISGSTTLFQVNYRGNLVDTTTYLCYNGDATARVIFDCSGITTATDRTFTFPDASGTIALTSAIPTGGLASGVYTPTRSAEANLDANVTPTQAQYLRVGNTVTVSGRVTGVDPTTTLTTTSFELTLPVASNLGAAEDLAGVAFCGAIAGQGAEITGSAANNTAVFTWKTTDITSQAWSYHFSYEVI